MAEQSKTVLITGGAGFVGSNVLSYLFAKYPNYHFIVLDTLTYAADMRNIANAIQQAPNFSFIKGDIRDKAVVEQVVGKSNFIVHFAAETHVARSISDDMSFFETDILGTQQIANAIRHNRNTVERFIHISTSEVYGTAQTETMDENHPLNPQSPYAAAKAGGDRLIYAYNFCYKIPSTVIRPFNIFGPRQHPEKVIPRFITSAILKEPLTIHGTGESQRDFTYVDDVARAIDIVLHAPQEKVIGETFNIGNGRGYSVKYIADLILNLLGEEKMEDKITTTSDRPGQVSRHTANFEKIKRTLGWQPTVVFEDGMKQVVDWYKNNRQWWEQKLEMKQVPIEVDGGKTELQ